MKDKLQKVTTSTLNFVEKHKVAIAITGTFVATAALSRWLGNGTIEAHTEFLKEKNLLDEFTTRYFEDPA